MKNVMKANISFLAILVTLFFVSCQSSDSEPRKETCAQFHTGTFKYMGSEDIRIERTNDQQIEYNLKGENGYLYTDIYSITWVNECEYFLTLDSTDHPQDLNFTKTDTMWTKISSVSRNGYTFTAIKGKEIFNGEVKRIDI